MNARVLSLIVLSCGCAASPESNVAANDAGGDADAMPAICRQVEARASACGQPFDERACGRELACDRALYRTEDAETVVSCLATRACDVPAERCVGDAAAKYAGDATVQALQKACAEKDAACGGGLATTVCSPELALLRDDLRAKVESCLAKDCEIVGECWQTVLQLAGCTR